ncbi:MAG TPA: single-stranded-DNA-specific exonuclease RecJ [Thermomicrobiales bacterium]|nr:single-stranded-DNA-specific exonuclease RecJ [Thermomicrobiales bacterium]
MSQTIWHEPDALPPEYASLHTDPLLAALLYQRGMRDVTSVSRFLQRQPSAAPDPYQIPGMEEAVLRVGKALQARETIGIFGDYDADGITATALLVRALQGVDSEQRRVIARLPTRAEGYGLSRVAIDELVDAGARLLIAVDCGSSDPEHVGYARTRGLDVIVIDHHQMAAGDTGPLGAIVVSAQLSPDPLAPARQLASVGLAYLLVSALAQEGWPIGDGHSETDLQDLVAIGTIADVAPLTGINRALVRDGLAMMRDRPRAGLAALCAVSDVKLRMLDAEDIGFRLAPRLNAAGRLGDPSLALDLLLTDDPKLASRIAGQLEAINVKRKIDTARMFDDAQRLLEQDPDWEKRPVIVVRSTDWTAGLVGIVAGRLAEQYGRPALVLHDDGERSRGSARSVPGLDITQTLGTPACNGLLLHYGGHRQAAGLTLWSTSVPALRSALENTVAATGMQLPLSPSLRLDAEIPIARLRLDTARALATLEPFGAGNERPLLLLRDVEISRYTVMGRDKSHLKLFIRINGREVPVLAWGAADRSHEFMKHRAWDLAITVGEDHWNGQARLHIEAKDFRPTQ